MLCDVQDVPSAQAAVMAWSPKAVLHAAGVSTKEALLDVGREQLAVAFGPKAFGASNLHIATRSLPLEASLMISSISVFWCRVGQASYAAANAFLDTYACVCRAQGQNTFSFALPGVEGMGMGAALNVSRSIQMALTEFDASFATLLMAQSISPLQVILPHSLERYLQGTLESKNPLFHDVVALHVSGNAYPARESPYALPLCRLAGRMSSSMALKMLKALPENAPVIVELTGLSLEPSKHLERFLKGVSSPWIVLCRSEISGNGALSLVDSATVALGEASCTFELSDADQVIFKRRKCLSGVSCGRFDASAALFNGWLDAVCSGEDIVSEARRIATRLSQISFDLLATCKTLLPAPSVEAAIVAMGTLHKRPPRSAGQSLVRVSISMDETFAVIELCDPKRSNTISQDLGEDVMIAAKALRQRLGSVRALALYGVGKHFSVGVNPYNYCSDARTPLPASALACKRLLDGFIELRSLEIPIVCAVHGKLIGAALAACLNADYILANADATFCHGNIVRGVCPLGMLSQTLVTAVGRSRAMRMYLANETLDSARALQFGLVHELCNVDVDAMQQRAVTLARLLAQDPAQSMGLVSARDPIDAKRIATEAVGHASCLIANGGRYADSSLAQQTDDVMLELTEMTLSGHSERSAAVSNKVFTSEVPVTLSQEMLEEMLHWPNEQILVVRGGPASDNFCLGGDPTQTRLENGEFLHDVPAFSRLLEHLQKRSQPTFVVCKGATRGFGMVFPCMGTCVLAHTDATFGFPEVRRGVLPGVVSVAAQRRLSLAACDHLFCTGDAISAQTAQQLGLVDFVGSPAEVENELARRLAQIGDAATEKPAQEMPDHDAVFEIDESKQVARVIAKAQRESEACDALFLLATSTLAEGSLKVVLIDIQGEARDVESTELVRAAANRAQAAVSDLTRNGIIVLCSASGQVTTGQLHLYALAHYCVIESAVTICVTDSAAHLIRRRLANQEAERLLSEHVVDAATALEVGFASEIVTTLADARALQFAQWLLTLPPMGIKYMLQLTFASVGDGAHLQECGHSERLQMPEKQKATSVSILPHGTLAIQPAI